MWGVVGELRGIRNLSFRISKIPLKPEYELATLALFLVLSSTSGERECIMHLCNRNGKFGGLDYSSDV